MPTEQKAYSKATIVNYDPFSLGLLESAVATTEAQKEIWGTLVLDSNSTLCYNESLSIEFTGDLDEVYINQAFQEVLKRHDALRSVFSPDGKYFFVKAYSAQTLSYFDFSQSKNPSAEYKELEKAQVLKRFDLINGPCFSGCLVKISETKSYLILNAHHIVCDGWSFAVILTELSSFYTQLKARQSLPQTIPAQFLDYALEEKSLESTQDKKYWLGEFNKPLHTKKIPLDFPRPSYRTYNSQRLDFVVPEEIVLGLKKLGSSNNSSFYTVLMGAFQVLLSKLTKSDELVVGIASAAQASSGQVDLVGHLVNLLPLRTVIDQNLNFNQFLKIIRLKMLDAYEHQNYSFGELLKELNLERNPSEIPLVNIVFNIDQQSPNQGLNFDRLKSSYSTIPREYENFELFINAVSCENKLVLECQYNKNLFKDSTISNWFNSYISLLEILLGNNQRAICTLDIPDLFIPSAKTELVKSSIPLPTNLAAEAKLLSIWKEVLNLEQINTSDNFFSLGGHSLLVIEMINQIRLEFAGDISARLVFENPTISGLASKLDIKDAALKPEVVLTKSVELTTAPVTNNQMQVWYLEQAYPGTLMHNLPSSIRVKFALDKNILEKALSLLIQRHSVLRTAIVIEQGVPVQKILSPDLPQFNIKLDVIKASEQNITTLLNSESRYSFDLTKAPLFKTKLYQLDQSDYVFYFMPHHSIWDGWSFDIFFEELDVLYGAILREEKPKFKNDPGITYADYSVWLNRSVDNGELKNQLAFWKDKLKSPLPVLELHPDFKRPTVATHVGSTLPFTFSESLSESVRAYAKKQKTSVFNVLLAAFKINLARHCNLEDIIVGSPVRSRNRPELENTIGYFVNAVALRTEIDLNRSFEENLKLIEKTCIEAFDNQTLPFQVVLNNVDHPRDKSRTPIFQTFFSFQDVSNRKSVLNGFPYTQINIDKESIHTDLDLWIKASDKKIEGAFEFRKDLYLSSSIERFYKSFIFLLEGLSTSEGAAVIDNSLLPQDQIKLVLEQWNNTTNHSVQFLPVHQIFEKTVSLHAQKIAVKNSLGELTYEELSHRSNRVAHGLISKGVGQGDLVGVCLTRDVNTLVTLLGILKTGAVYVPLDPSFPQSRLDYMVNHSKPKVLVTDLTNQNRFDMNWSTVLLEQIVHDATLASTIPRITVSLNDTAYVIYTSGSTGDPKGVQISHQALSNFLVSMTKKPGMKSSDKILAVTTLSFDIAGLEFFLPIINGASIFIANVYDVIDGQAMKGLIESYKINFMQATPSTWRLLLASGWSGGSDFKALCGGESFPKDLALQLISICSEVWNMYGPTETTIWSTCEKLEKDLEIVTIGRPIDNTYTYILDKGLNLAPLGSIGELYIGGLGLADGYYKMPKLTAEKFIPNPFRPGQLMYATGDLARFTSDGRIECLGRQDGQVKVRGYRIELGEIEVALSKIDAIKESSVITKEIRTGEVRIVAFVVLKTETLLDEKDLRIKLAQKLPKYMIPSHFVNIERLPQTLNGKIDRKALASLAIETKTSLLVNQAPKTSQVSLLEIELSELWESVLGVTEFEPTDNFFDIGGNSLIAVQLFSKISQRFNLNLPLSLLLEAPDFRSFAIAVRAQLPGERTKQKPYSYLVPIKAEGSKNPIFSFHGVGGNVLNYVALVPALDKERPLVGVQSAGLNHGTPFHSIEEMASAYIKEIKLYQPVGPYFLCGGSMGGTVALEVAQQLKQQGDKIDKIVMFDTFGPRSQMLSYEGDERTLFEKIRSTFTYRKRLLIHSFQMKISKILGLSIPLQNHLFEIELNNYRALATYIPREYDGDLFLIRAKIKSSGWYSDPLMGWGKIIKGDISTFEIDAQHNDFIETPELKKVLSGLV